MRLLFFRYAADTSATCCPTISDEGRCEITGASVHNIVVCRGLLQRILAGTCAGIQIKPMKAVQNTAARLVSGARLCDHNDYNSTQPPLASGAVQKGDRFKTAILVWKCVHGIALAYLVQRIQELCVLLQMEMSVRQRSLGFYVRLTVWNSLPLWSARHSLTRARSSGG